MRRLTPLLLKAVERKFLTAQALGEERPGQSWNCTNGRYLSVPFQRITVPFGLGAGSLVETSAVENPRWRSQPKMHRRMIRDALTSEDQGDSDHLTGQNVMLCSHF
jgi:hypothetical protein